jgi:hypothetical protein
MILLNDLGHEIWFLVCRLHWEGNWMAWNELATML